MSGERDERAHVIRRSETEVSQGSWPANDNPIRDIVKLVTTLNKLMNEFKGQQIPFAVKADQIENLIKTKQEEQTSLIKTKQEELTNLIKGPQLEEISNMKVRREKFGQQLARVEMTRVLIEIGSLFIVAVVVAALAFDILRPLIDDAVPGFGLIVAIGFMLPVILVLILPGRKTLHNYLNKMYYGREEEYDKKTEDITAAYKDLIANMDVQNQHIFQELDSQKKQLLEGTNEQNKSLYGGINEQNKTLYNDVKELLKGQRDDLKTWEDQKLSALNKLTEVNKTLLKAIGDAEKTRNLAQVMKDDAFASREFKTITAGNLAKSMFPSDRTDEEANKDE